MKIERDIVAGGRELALVVTTEHDGCLVHSGVHRFHHPRHQGGVRFVTHGSLAELAHLAHGMSEKCAAAGVPVDGMKALVICPHGIPESFEQRASILRRHIDEATGIDQGMVFGPDMGCPEDVLDLIAEDRRYLKNITGLSRKHGGLEIDRNALTAIGVFEAVRAVSAQLGSIRATIQGLGAVGAPLAIMLHDAGCRLVAVSNVLGTLCDPEGLDVPVLHSLWKQHGDDCLGVYAAETGCELKEPDALFQQEGELFVPAARTSVLSLLRERDRIAQENPQVRSIEQFVEQSGVEIIAEAANHPLTFAAEAYAEGCGVTVLPDIIANCGGMIGCWYEYEHREALLSDPQAYEKGLRECKQMIGDVIRRNLAPLGQGRMTAERLRGLALAR